MSFKKDQEDMRVSPALLASLSLVAIASLPSQAAESSEATPTVESTKQQAEIDAQAPAEAQPVAPAVAQHLNPTTLEPTVSLQRLLSGVSSSAPTNAAIETAGRIEIEISQADPLPGEAPEEPDFEIEIEDGNIDISPVEDSAADSPEEAATDAVEEAIEEADRPSPAVPSIPTGEGTPETENPENEDTDEAEAETRVLVAEVDVVSSNEQRPLTPELIDAVYNAAGTVPGRTTTRSQLQEDINSIFGTGFFSNVRAEPEDTPIGVKVTFFVEPNPILTNVDVRNRQVLPDDVVDEIFSAQYGQILNIRDFQNGVLDLNDWYQENGYVLAQVTASPQISDDGIVTLIVAEGEIEAIEVRYIDADGELTDEDGNPIGGRTKPYIVTREFDTQPGDVFEESAIQQDIGQVFGLGIFEDIRLSLDPGDEDPRKVKVIVNIAERDTGSIGASLGFNLRGDLFGQLSYNEDNFRGRNQKLRTEGRVTTRGDFLFDINFTDPWIQGDPYRTSYTTSLFNRRSTSLIFDNGPIEVDLPNGDTPRINRFGTGISFSRPLEDGLSLSLGAQYERVALLDAGGSVTPRDELGNLLTADESGRDDLFTVRFGAVLDNRNNPSLPTSGNIIRLGTEQAIPIGNGSLAFNKIRGSYSQYVPVNFFGRNDSRETLAFNLQGGTTIGSIPPYEAFPLGGGNSVRGFEEGAVGSGRSFALGTVEYRFPLFSEFLNGALFADYGTDLGSGDSVPGDPAGVRGKPGDGFGYGAGVRVQTPLGALRLDYGLSEEGSRFHFGFGERF
ncbi:MAG: BamA/TamA family outer membrane protein [Cyanobacteria bacterium P01_D01_bin.105]